MTSAPAMRAFVVKELQHILRDRQTLTVLLLMPLVQVLLFGNALRNDVRDVRVAVVDPVPSVTTQRLRDAFVATRRFRVVADARSMDAVEPLFRRGAADMALVLDPAFTEQLGRGEPAKVLLVTDASDPNTGSTMQAYALAVLGDHERSLRAAGAAGIAVQTRMRFNPTLESVNLFVPGLIALVLTLVSSLMTAISLSREKERGTLEILLVSPLRPWQIIVGKVVPYIGLGLANASTALAVAWLVFRIPFRGSALLLLAESLLYTVTSLSLGVLIAANASSQRAAMLGALVGTMLPNTLLSGMIFPIASMPAPLRLLTNVVPARWFIVIARGVMLKGVGLEHLWAETLVLCGMTIVLLSVAVRRFHARLA
ncbi:MAG TPA: ABC transporter permease [Gemmatimonadaceae bacterium]|nr:ABC transporter permease [Gemmatimonadaceae bacterium]